MCIISFVNVESNIPCLPTPNISRTDVLLALRRLKPKPSVGPDGINAFCLKDCAVVSARLLA